MSIANPPAASTEKRRADDETANAEQTRLLEALDGFLLVSLAPGTKRPVQAAWPDNPATWNMIPSEHNVGLLLGPRYRWGGFVQLDIDSSTHADHLAVMEELGAHGLTPTATARTGGKHHGYCVLFAMPHSFFQLPVRGLASIAGVTMEVRKGGQCVIPPSGPHASADTDGPARVLHRYNWIQDLPRIQALHESLGWSTNDTAARVAWTRCSSGLANLLEKSPAPTTNTSCRLTHNKWGGSGVCSSPTGTVGVRRQSRLPGAERTPATEKTPP